jgi:hypothetical protein
MELAADLQKVAVAHDAGSSCMTYTCQWNMFVAWCDAQAVPRVTLPSTDVTVALYLQSVVKRAKNFAPVKAASTAMFFFQKINLFNNEPTQSRRFALCGVLLRGGLALTTRSGRNTSNGRKF